MNNNGWITDRLPRLEDATFDPCRYEDSDIYGVVWVISGGVCKFSDWEVVKFGQPWQPVQRPKPYVGNVLYEVQKSTNGWGVYSNTHVANHVVTGVRAFGIPTREAAERIAAIYNEVME